jgi:hypothetical protein
LEILKNSFDHTFVKKILIWGTPKIKKTQKKESPARKLPPRHFLTSLFLIDKNNYFNTILQFIDIFLGGSKMGFESIKPKMSGGVIFYEF